MLALIRRPSVLAACLILFTSSNASARPPGWNVVSSPSPGTVANSLRGVAGTSAKDVWAVGSYSDGTTFSTLIEHSNGKSWTTVTSPSPDDRAELFGVAALSRKNAWAVGDSVRYGVGQFALAEHWNGTSWTSVSIPTPDEAQETILYGVSAASAQDVWAVGFYRDTAGTRETLVEHWDGQTWSIVPSPNPSPWPENVLTGVSALSATDVWAVGYCNNNYSPGFGCTFGNFQTLVEHWDGTRWSVVPSMSPGSGVNMLNGVSALAATDVWAVGRTDVAPGGSVRTLIEHWDGTSWTVVPSPSPDIGDVLYGVSALSTGNVWAVGNQYDGDTYRTLAERWNGVTWDVKAPANPQFRDHLFSVLNRGWGVWAVGIGADSAGEEVTLIERWK